MLPFAFAPRFSAACPVACIIGTLTQAYTSWQIALPPKAPVRKQPYIQEDTLRWLEQLRDWSAHRVCRLLVAALEVQEARLQRHIHQLARRDKRSHFLSLTEAATRHWHEHGCALDAITHLRWASRRAADRRQVYAAGGFQIEAELEEQFRSQEQAARIPAVIRPTGLSDLGSASPRRLALRHSQP